MLEGVNGFTYGKAIPSSAHSQVVADTCVACHMQTVVETDAVSTHVGGHTFKPSFSDGTNPSVDLVGACKQCHGRMVTKFDFRLMDYNDDGIIEGVQTEVQHLLDELSTLLPPVGKAKRRSPSMPPGHGPSWKRPTTGSMSPAMAAWGSTTRRMRWACSRPPSPT